MERGSGRALTFRVPDRTRETLVTRLVQEFIQPGTVILSDKFSPYFNLNDIGYTHLMVNHSENFVDPYTGAHTNTIEGVWNAVKKKLKRMCGTFKHQLPSYLDEFNWQREYPGECFEMMLQHIAEPSPLSPIPLPFSFSPYPLPLSTPAMQAKDSVTNANVTHMQELCL